MATQSAARPARRSLWLSRNGMLLAAALLSSIVTWWYIAWPSLTFATAAKHSGHLVGTFSHVLGGTGMLLFGGLNLYLAARKDHFPLHRLVGRTYLAFGAFGAISALIVTLTTHKEVGGPIFTNVTISLVTLALAWLAFAALGWRAARNRRFQQHGQFMIRSYVLAWAFVFCRIGERLANLDELGGGAAFIWLSWVAPMILCEIGLQWSEGSKKAVRARPEG